MAENTLGNQPINPEVKTVAVAVHKHGKAKKGHQANVTGQPDHKVETTDAKGNKIGSKVNTVA